MCLRFNEAADVEVERQGLLGYCGCENQAWKSILGLREGMWKLALNHDSFLNLLRAQSWQQPHGLSILYATNWGISREISLPE